MSGWNAAKVDAFKVGFTEFLGKITIDSKDTGGGTILGDHIYYAQQRFLDAVWGALSNDIHDISCLKSRQLGISTICKPLVLFWMGVHDGLQGAMIFDTDAHKESARRDIETMVRELHEHHPTYQFPTIVRSNRYGFLLSNRSFLHFMAAGVKSSRSSGVLGRSAGLSLTWESELCSWENSEGITSLRSSISHTNPNRLYLKESTARGPNFWKTMWEEAKADDLNQAAVFIGWWAHLEQRLRRGTPQFARYGALAPDAEEQVRIDAVEKLYGFRIDQEQLAWYRYFSDPTQKENTGAPDIQDGMIQQDQPWTEFEAFILSGSTFFNYQTLTELHNTTVSAKFQAFKFIPGGDFTTCQIIPARTYRDVELRLWEEPQIEASYVIGVDPAYGHSEKNDRSAIVVCKAYADGLEQVAEYISGSVMPHQLAWVYWTLTGYYGSRSGQPVMSIVELNGPGEAVWREMMIVRKIVESGYLRKDAEAKGVADIFRNARQYIYGRSDSMSGGHNVHWKAVCIKTPLPTPHGWTTMEDIKIGDELFNELGLTCNVISVGDIQYDRECYNIIFDDGSKIVSDAEHLWQMDDGQLLRSIDIYHAGGGRIAIARALILPAVDLPVNPYVLGVWLGDGHSADGRFCGHIDDFEEISDCLSACGAALGPIAIDPRNGTVCTRNIIGLYNSLGRLLLLGNKHIPSIYLRSSYEQRMELLRGLMDTDGRITQNNGRQCSFSTSNDLIASSFAELLRSVGIKAKSLVRFKEYTYCGENRISKPAYQFWFTAYPNISLFKLTRKLERQQWGNCEDFGRGPDKPGRTGPPRGKAQFAKSKCLRIISVEKADSVPVRCIAVDSPSHLYLAGEGMVPTHNTTSQLKVAIMERLRDFIHQGTLVLKSAELVEELRNITRDGDKIEAEGKGKDDRAIALALCCRAWEEKMRRGLIALNKTRANERARRGLAAGDQRALFQQYQLQSFFRSKAAGRVAAQQSVDRASWRGSRRY